MTHSSQAGEPFDTESQRLVADMGRTIEKNPFNPLGTTVLMSLAGLTLAAISCAGRWDVCGRLGVTWMVAGAIPCLVWMFRSLTEKAASLTVWTMAGGLACGALSGLVFVSRIRPASGASLTILALASWQAYVTLMMVARWLRRG